MVRMSVGSAVLLTALALSSEILCQELPPERAEQLVKELRTEILGAPSSSPVHFENKFAVDALIRVIDEELKPDGNARLVVGAIGRLSEFPDVAKGVERLVRLIDYGSQREYHSWPIQSYPAARALVKMGVPARRRILGSLGESLPEHKLHLMAYVLLELDKNDDDDHDVHLTVIRLMREIQRRKLREVADSLREQKQAEIKNLERMVQLLLEPNFIVKQVPPEPKDESRADQGVATETLIEQFLRKESAKRP